MMPYFPHEVKLSLLKHPISKERWPIYTVMDPSLMSFQGQMGRLFLEVPQQKGISKYFEFKIIVRKLT